MGKTRTKTWGTGWANRYAGSSQISDVNGQASLWPFSYSKSYSNYNKTGYLKLYPSGCSVSNSTQRASYLSIYLEDRVSTYIDQYYSQTTGESGQQQYNTVMSLTKDSHLEGSIAHIEHTAEEHDNHNLNARFVFQVMVYMLVPTNQAHSSNIGS